jgi:acyl dehydratase
VRATVKVADLDEAPGGAQMTLELTFEVEGGDKPACVAQTLMRVYTA